MKKRYIQGPNFPQTLKERFPEIENYCRFQTIYRTNVFKAGEIQLTDMQFVGADTSIADFFPIPLIAGNIHRTLSSPNEAAISVQTAIKVFGRTDVLGQSFFSFQFTRGVE